MSDEEDLESLFDQIASERTSKSEPPPAPAEDAPSTAAAEVDPSAEPPLAAPREGAADSPDWYNRVGKIARNLHDALHELGYDRTMQKMVVALPDTRDRLSYISELTKNAAERALVAVETAKPLQEEMGKTSTELHAKWDQVLGGQLQESDFRPLVLSTQEFLKSVPARTAKTDEQLLDIMMAQDFHDLTGQVIKKIVEVAQTLESELVELLVVRGPADHGLLNNELVLNGPVINHEGRTDIVSNQIEVDELLERLGF